MKLHLVLVDDWELRGDGSGDMEKIQFETLSKMLAIYEKYNLKASINAEIMQQLAHLEWGKHYPHLIDLAKKWESLIQKAYSNGHDVQLHIHPQWSEAKYENNKWHLSGNWSILEYSKEQARDMIRKCKYYLESQLQMIDPSYRCVSFRSGSWCIAPSSFILELLSEEGIIFDMSIAGGLIYNNSKIKLNYSTCEEGFFPYYPHMKDARKLSNKVESIVCIPTNTFNNSYPFVCAKLFAELANKISSRLGLRYRILKRPDSVKILTNQGTSSTDQYNVWKRGYLQKLISEFKPQIADLSNLSFSEMKRIISSARRKAARSQNNTILPVILENHTKDIGDFGPIERFAAYISSLPDVEVFTLKQISENIKKGLYQIKLRSAVNE